MKLFLTVLVFSISNFGFAQTIEEREMDLRSYHSHEGWGKKKDKAIELLQIDGYNRIAIEYLLRLYKENDNKDSIPIFWNNLIQDNPNSLLPYLKRVELSQYENLTNEDKIEYLNIAYGIDNMNKDVNYLLATLNYEKFIDSNSVEIASLTLDYLDNLCSIESWYKAYLKFPCIQLSNYTSNSSNLELYNSYPDRNSFFPIFEFANLKEGWEQDFNYNVFSTYDRENWTSSGIKLAQFSLNWYSNHLEALEEPILYDTISKSIIRFTWLRSFHHPIVVRVELTTDKAEIFWKMSDGAGGYGPGKIIKDKSRELKELETKSIISELDSLEFYHIPTNSSGMVGTDGAQWILEVLKNGNYHVVDRWSGGVIESFCLKLLNLTSLKIKDDDVY